MARTSHYIRRYHRDEANALFSRANEQWERGQLRSAFRLFLSGAKAGDPGAELNLGYFYDTGQGVGQNRERALYWYKRAFRHGYAGAATNLGTIFRDEGQAGKALMWFRRAVKAGDADANLEIGKIYLRRRRNVGRAIPYLRKVWRSKRATEGSKEEAGLLLAEVSR